MKILVPIIVLSLLCTYQVIATNISVDSRNNIGNLSGNYGWNLNGYFGAATCMLDTNDDGVLDTACNNTWHINNLNLSGSGAIDRVGLDLDKTATNQSTFRFSGTPIQNMYTRQSLVNNTVILDHDMMIMVGYVPSFLQNFTADCAASGKTCMYNDSVVWKNLTYNAFANLSPNHVNDRHFICEPGNEFYGSFFLQNMGFGNLSKIPAAIQYVNDTVHACKQWNSSMRIAVQLGYYESTPTWTTAWINNLSVLVSGWNAEGITVDYWVPHSYKFGITQFYFDDMLTSDYNSYTTLCTNAGFTCKNLFFGEWNTGSTPLQLLDSNMTMETSLFHAGAAQLGIGGMQYRLGETAVFNNSGNSTTIEDWPNTYVGTADPQNNDFWRYRPFFNATINMAALHRVGSTVHNFTLDDTNTMIEVTGNGTSYNMTVINKKAVTNGVRISSDVNYTSATNYATGASYTIINNSIVLNLTANEVRYLIVTSTAPTNLTCAESNRGGLGQVSITGVAVYAADITCAANHTSQVGIVRQVQG